MASEILKRDQNFVTVIGGITNDSAQDVRMLRIDPVTGRVLASAAAGTFGISTVTDGVTTVTSATTLTFVGATVSNGGGGNAIVTVSGGGAVSSVSNSDGTLTISPTTGAVVASLNLSNANVWVAMQTVQLNALGVTSVEGLVLQNTTAAALNAQQISPLLRFSGLGWGTTAGTSQNVDFIVDMLPVQGTIPSGTMRWRGSIAGGAYATSATLTTAGAFATQGAVSGGGAGSSNLSFGIVNVSNFLSYNSNLGASNATAVYQFGGSTNVNFRNALAGITSSVAITVGNSYANTIIGSSPVSTAASGTHGWLANAVVNTLGTVTSGGATVTNTASLYVGSAGTGGTNNYALYTAGGLTNHLSTTEQLRLSFDATNYSSFTVNSGGSLVIAPTGGITINPSNGTILLTGSVSTITNLSVSGSITSNATAANANFLTAVQSTGQGSSAASTARYLFAGAGTVNYRTVLGGAATTTLGASNSYANVLVNSAPITAAATGTHAVLANLVVNALGTVTNGSSVPITNTASLYIDGAGTGGTNNYSLMVNAGNSLFNGNVSLGVAGNKLSIATGTNASIGTATLVGGTVTVNTTAVTASSKIFLTDATTGALTNVGSPTVGTIVAGTSFVINSTNVLDASAVNWLIIN